MHKWRVVPFVGSKVGSMVGLLLDCKCLMGAAVGIVVGAGVCDNFFCIKTTQHTELENR